MLADALDLVGTHAGRRVEQDRAQLGDVGDARHLVIGKRGGRHLTIVDDELLP